MDAVGRLRNLGFGEYESKAYVALLRHGAMNGYELAKAAGVPRPNIYGVLQRLEERGAVLRAETPAGTRYSALSPEELLRGLGAQFRDALSDAAASLASVRPGGQGDHAWNISGYSQAIQNARALLTSARRQVLLAIMAPEARALSAALLRTRAEGIRLTTLCLQGCADSCGHCQGQVHRYPVETGRETRQLVIVVDGEEMLAAEVGPDEAAWAVRSRQPLLLHMAAWHVQQTIFQSAVLSDLRARGGERNLSAETLALLESQDAGGVGSRFTWYVRRLMSPEVGDLPPDDVHGDGGAR